MLTALFVLLAAGAGAQPIPSTSTSTILPTYVALGPNLNDFDRFADGGPDANWYVGYNNAWIVRLPPAPAGDFPRAFVGAKIGRAKTRPNPKKPWLRELIPGKIYIGVSQNAWFSTEQSFFLAETSDIPLEANPASYSPGTGASEWFWAEVPTALISSSKDNYLAVWSPTTYFQSASSSPILAAASADPDDAGAREARAWNNRSVSGVGPRRGAKTLETPINNIHPALAIKLIPPGQDEVLVSEFTLNRLGKRVVASFSAGGENLGEAWVEVSPDQLDWVRLTKPLRHPPFQFTLPPEKLPSGGYLRGAARDITGSTGFSEPYRLPYDR